jgi:hypothetical protein
MENLKELLKDAIVTFTFKKTNGEERTAVGTRCLTIATGMTADDKPKGIKPETPGVVAFWDCEKHAWRSCREDAVISIDKVLSRNEVLGIDMF